ncbi:ATP-grasp domain-containing protein [Cellulomonas bogoriensis]|uniref:ATP-grasp domain-containing protein n=1 Tax=Cellulomonas bogoriensis 69B4 = DSM 16987 TaxID=1386082 RepID=A0A0A0BLD9_9CELL|nr:hypothetical protein [Cellulomonas bogoriensis]KGM09333.1 hypothetical protein N869_07315 [Cellulomonas bogoriensis 69B4 = DSM 16987]
MTRVLVLQQPSSAAAVDDWLAAADADVEVLLVTGPGARRAGTERGARVRVVTLDAYEGAAATAQVRAVAREWRPNRVVSNSEKDVLRAATIRSELGLPGTPARLAVEFRDKVRMKALFERAGLPTARWARVQCVDDVLAALEAMGPFVLKPRGGVGSQGVHVLAGPDDVWRLLTTAPQVLDEVHADALMVEELVDGTVLHVDAVLDDADVLLAVPSRYLHPPHTFASHDVASVCLDPGSAAHTAAVAATRALACGLPAGHGVAVVHLELHLLPNGTVLAGEVAARLGGGMIKGTLAHAYGVDLSRESYLLAAGLRGASQLVERPNPPHQVLAGHMLWTSRRPHVTRDALPAWAHGFWAADGDGPHVAAHSADAAGGVIVEGENEAALVDRITRVG